MAINGDAKRYRLSVPIMDTSVQKWLDAQINLSISIRHLIRDDIAKHGYTDITCRDVEQGSEPKTATVSDMKKTQKQAQNGTNIAPETTPRPKQQTVNIPAPKNAPIPDEIMGEVNTQPISQPTPQVIPQQAPPSGQNTDDMLASIMG